MWLSATANDTDPSSHDDKRCQVTKDTHQPSKAFIEGLAQQARCRGVHTESAQGTKDDQEEAEKVRAAPVQRFSQRLSERWACDGLSARWPTFGWCTTSCGLR